MSSGGPKRPVTFGDHDERRDVRRTSAPPVGSELDQLRRQAEAARAKLARSYTPVHGTPIEIVDARAKRAADNSLAAATTIAEVRGELLAADARLDNRLDRQDEALKDLASGHRELAGHVGDLRADMAGARGELGILVGMVRQQLDASVEVGKARKLDPIEGRKFWRSLALAIFGTGGLAFALIALLSQKC